jgi:DNA-directed RNA polymerase subunit beta'
MSVLFKNVVLSLYSPEKILKDSFGEITNHKTINSRTLKPELGGLFDPRVFGPSADYECFCGKYEGIKNKNQKCDQCNVLISSSRIRRWRMGHVKLNSPITNPLVLKGILSRLSKIIDIPSKSIEDLVYYNCYVVIDKGFSSIIKDKQILEKKIDFSLLNEILQEMLESKKFNDNGKKRREIENLIENLNVDTSKKVNPLDFKIVFIEDYLNFLQENWNVKIKTGSEALFDIFKKVDLGKELENLETIKRNQSEKKNSNLDSINDRIRIIKSFIDNNLKLEWMIMYNLPVIPSGIRPATKLADDNSIATTQINNLYRKVILINKRLAEYTELNKKMRIFFLEIVHNERRRLQKAVDQLFQGNPSNRNDSNNVKSLSQMLSGKEGIPRKHSLGKRVDYSARSVIVPNPSLKIDQVGLPVEMALVIYKPFLIRELLERKIAFTVKEAKELIIGHDSIIFTLLNYISKNHPVILNRAPTLHKFGILGFFPILVLGKSIQLHPLVTTEFNADFDGDLMAAHLPLTKKARDEVQDIMLASKNIINSQNNNLISTPTQDIILGIYHFTQEVKKDSVKLYYDIDSITRDYDLQEIDIKDVILVPASLLKRNFKNCTDKLIFTTLGKIMFNEILPSVFPFYISDLKKYNETYLSSETNVVDLRKESINIEERIRNFNSSDGWKKKDITIFLNNLLKFVSLSDMAKFLDDLKSLGFYFATKSGISISIFDIPALENKNEFSLEAQKKIIDIEDYENKGFYTKEESYEKKIEVWAECKNKLEKELIKKLNQSKDTSLYSIWNSEARTNSENLMQIFAMRGNMTNYKGEVIETPILSSLKEGLNPFEFFISVYGAIKGMIDTALKTAEAGYLSRRLVETVQNIVVTKNDCGTENGSWFESLNEHDYLTDEESVLINLEKRIYGRFLSSDVKDELGNLLLERGSFVLKKELEIIKENNIKGVFIRTSMECELFPGVCQKCYGLNLSKKGEITPLGMAVGIIAAQSLGEPGTQLTMRTFHSGGVIGKQEDIVQGLPKVKELLDNVIPTKETRALLARISGEITEITMNEETRELTITQKNDNSEETYFVPYGKKSKIKKGQFVKLGESITTGKIDLSQYLEIAGRYSCQEYIKKEIWKVYYSQGIEINEKHIELFTRQMLNKVEITKEVSGEKYLVGDVINCIDLERINKKLVAEGKEKIEAKPILLGIKKIINYFPSFLSGISFQNISKLLLEYTLYQPKDHLEGVKENMIIGQLVPVGTGFRDKTNKLSKKNL